MSEERDRSQYQRALQYSTLGLQFAVTVALGAFAGLWLDGRLGTSPLFAILGGFGGFGAGFYFLIKGVERAR